MTTRPTFQPQNPAISGCRLGWQSCTCFAGAMAASYDLQKAKVVTGCSVRVATNDTVGGTNLAQVDTAVNKLTAADLSLHYGLPWATFAKFINAGMSGVLQGWYGPIADSRFDAGNGFRGNHAVLVLPGWVVMDPLADGRYPGVYKYHGEAYPQSLLRTYAGKLNISSTGYRALGDGLVYAGMTRDNVHDYHIRYINGGPFWYYVLGHDGKIAGRKAHKYTTTTGTTCTQPAWYPGNSADPPPSGFRDVDGGRSMVRITGGGLKGYYVAVPQSQVRIEVTS